VVYCSVSYYVWSTVVLVIMCGLL